MVRKNTPSQPRSFCEEDRPVLLVADRNGEIYDEPLYRAAGMTGGDFVQLTPDDLIPLPESSRFYFIPKGRPIGFDKKGKPTVIEDVYPVAAFLPPGYTRTFLPAYEEIESHPILPLWSYTAVSWYRGGFYAAAVQVAWMDKADPELHDDEKLIPLVEKKRKDHPKNRLLRHLEKCALYYHCFAAKNIFFGRWEAPLPTSPACNARCIGCLSLQEGDCCASQDRISFVPTPSEIASAAIPHLQKAEDAIVSFGQGCEGEPLLQAKTLAKSIKDMRSATNRGIINLNTNGFSAEHIRMLRDAGLDSIRISMNSPDKERYNAYYRPRGYRHEDVIEAVKVSKQVGLFTSINLLVFPGYTDSEDEISKLFTLIRQADVDLMHMRNLSIDPSVYLSAVPVPEGKIIGIGNLVQMVKEEFPHLEIGYFNLPEKDIKRVRAGKA
jgi:pyruvate-formate lyase-activating enzyme